jgi:hypothetical protein
MHEGLLANGWKDGNHWSPRETLDAWLKWEGIIGYTDQIQHAVLKLDNLTFIERITKQEKL